MPRFALVVLSALAVAGCSRAREHTPLEQGRSDLLAGRWEQAIAAANESIRLEPDSAGVFALRGRAYYGLGDTPRAIQDYDRAIELAPDDFEAYYDRAVALESLGETELAHADQKKARDLDPARGQAYLYSPQVRPLDESHFVPAAKVAGDATSQAAGDETRTPSLPSLLNSRNASRSPTAGSNDDLAKSPTLKEGKATPPPTRSYTEEILGIPKKRPSTDRPPVSNSSQETVETNHPKVDGGAKSAATSLALPSNSGGKIDPASRPGQLLRKPGELKPVPASPDVIKSPFAPAKPSQTGLSMDALGKDTLRKDAAKSPTPARTYSLQYLPSPAPAPSATGR